MTGIQSVANSIAEGPFCAVEEDEIVGTADSLEERFQDLNLEASRAREDSLGQTHEGCRNLAAELIRAQEDERRRVAREMHDDWTQRLALLSIDLAKLEKHLGVPETALPLLRTMQEQVVNLSEDVHALSRQLHPSILDDLGLVGALHSECASFSRREGITVVYCPEQISNAPPKAIALCVYRVAQEALRNVAKHATVKHVWVSLVGTPSELFLRVQDKGVGFNPAALRCQPGLGLSSMKDRVRLVHGELTVTSAVGQGTTIEVRVPLARGCQSASRARYFGDAARARASLR
jgi:signal transduction histidine kinase